MMVTDDAAGDHHIPVVQEFAQVDKREVDFEQVRVHTGHAVETVTVRDTLARQSIEVRRVPIEREVTEAPSVREEGDTVIIPVLEERLVTLKRLFLVEEIHIVRQHGSEEVAIPTELRRTVVDIERKSLAGHAGPDAVPTSAD